MADSRNKSGIAELARRQRMGVKKSKGACPMVEKRIFFQCHTEKNTPEFRRHIADIQKLLSKAQRIGSPMLIKALVGLLNSHRHG